MEGIFTSQRPLGGVLERFFGVLSAKKASRRRLETDFDPKIAVLEAKRSILEAKMDSGNFT